VTASAEELANGAGALDLLLYDAALGTWRRFLPWAAGMRPTAGLARRPDLLRAHGAKLVREYGRIAVGRSHIAAAPRDRRFAEPAWAENPLLRAVMQAYLVSSDTAQAALRRRRPNHPAGQRAHHAPPAAAQRAAYLRGLAS
jgi:polyhydroxyalkanoate synthase